MKDNIKKILREGSEDHKSIEIQAPNDLLLKPKYKSIFLAGSIEGNGAEEWQQRIIKETPDKPYIYFNPRRDDYDKTLTQDIKNVQFKEQVEWELSALDIADNIIMYFDKETKSPISLLELGLYATSKKMVVCCPEGFWRKGNVDIVCETYNIKQVNSLDELIKRLISGDLFD